MLAINTWEISVIPYGDGVQNVVRKTRKLMRALGVQGWRSGESTRLPPMWPGFDYQSGCHTWVELVGSLLCTENFFRVLRFSPLLKNQHFT